MRRIPRYLFISNFLLIAPLALSGCGEGSRRDKAEPPNVVLITIDTLRADHLSCYGYERETTPFLDRLAEQGCIFTRCCATSSWTSPSVASLFTGLYPRSHGVRHGFVREGEIVNQEKLDSSFLTLAEAMRENGYATFGISTNGHISAETGMAQGFDEFTTLWFKNAPATHRKAERLKKKLEGAGPYFLWIFYFDPHLPYRSRTPWIEAYSPNPELAGEWERKHERDLLDDKKFIRENQDILSSLRDLYDSEISYTDSFIEKLFQDVLPGEEGLVIVTADHGEGFLEHGELGHAKSLFEEEVRVPLIVKERGMREEGCVVKEPVTVMDVFPTIMDYVGAEVPPGVQGRSLLPLIKGGVREGERALVCELDRGRSMKSIRSGRWKLIRNENRDRDLLYDLEADPGEETNLEGEEADTARRLAGELEHWQAEFPEFTAPREESGLREEQAEKLKSLGYIQ